MSKQIISLIVVIIILFLSVETQAFDGKRKGFVLSGGVGWTKFQVPENRNFSLKSAFTIGSIMGYGFNNQNLIVIDRSAFLYNSNNGGYVMSQAFGYSWFHYFKKEKKSKFAKLGYDTLNNAFLFGGGYMFSNNIQIGLTYSHLTKIDDRDYIKLLISYVAF